MSHETFHPEEVEFGPYTSLIDSIVEEHEPHIPKMYAQKEQIQGRLRAVELCKELRAEDREIFEATLFTMTEGDLANQTLVHHGKLSADDCALHHHATDQFRHYCEIIRLAEHDLLGTETGYDEPHSALARVDYRKYSTKAGYRESNDSAS